MLKGALVLELEPAFSPTDKDKCVRCSFLALTICSFSFTISLKIPPCVDYVLFPPLVPFFQAVSAAVSPVPAAATATRTHWVAHSSPPVLVL